MTWHQRLYYHRMLKARQITGFNPGDSGAGGPASSSSSTQPGGGGNGGNGSGSTSSGAAQTPDDKPNKHQTSTQASASSTSSSSSSPSTTSASSTSTSSSSSSTSSSSTTSSSSSTSATSTSTSLSTVTSSLTSQTPLAGASTSTLIFSSPTLTSTGAATSTSSSSNSVGGVSVGAIVGAIAGGLFGLLALLAIGSWILRRWNRHTAERDFNDEYNTAEDISPTHGPDVFAPQMTQHTSSPSLGGSAGLAGQGIMASRAAAGPGPGAYHGGYAGYPNEDESFTGPYSSQPQVQAPYNPEAYGQYTPYHPGADYQEATRGFQGQRGFEAPANIGYAISEPPAPAPAGSPPPPPSSPPKTTAAAALAAARAAAVTAPAATEGRKSAVYTEEDAYGGF